MEHEPSILKDWKPPVLLGDPSSEALYAYRSAIKRPLLTPEQSSELVHAIEESQAAKELLTEPEISESDRQELEAAVAAGNHATEILVMCHLQQVLGIAHDFAYKSDSVLEYASTGNADLVEASRSYKVIEGASFAAFTATVARNAMVERAMRVRRESTGLTETMVEMLRDIRRAYDAALINDPNADFMQIAEDLGFEKAVVVNALRLSNTETQSFDASLELGEELEDKSSESDIEAVLNKVLLDKVWGVAKEMRRKELLSEREWTIFVARFRDGLSQYAIADIVGIRQTGISDYEESILAKIKQAIDNPTSLELPYVTHTSDVKKPIHLLAILGIPVKKNQDPMAMAQKIVEHADLTDRQKLILTRLLGLDGGQPITVTELAKELGVTGPSINLTRRKAIQNIIGQFKNPAK